VHLAELHQHLLGVLQQNAPLLDLFGEDSWRINVCAGELEVRRPSAPTPAQLLQISAAAKPMTAYIEVD